MTTAQPSARRSAGPRRRGRRGGGRACRGAGVGGVDPGVRAHEAVAGAADQAAAVGAHDLGGLVEDHLHVPRVLAVLLGQLARLPAGEDGVSATTRPSALETTLWATASTSVGAGRRCGGGLGQQRLEVVAGSDLRHARQATSEIRPGRESCAVTPPRGPAGRAPRACAGRPRPPLERRAQGGEVVGRVDVEPERRQPKTWTVAPAARAGRVAGERAGPERRRHHARRGEQQRVGAAAVAVGDDRHRGRRRAPSRRQLLAGRPPGSRRAPAARGRRPRTSAASMPAPRPRTARLVGVVDHRGARAARPPRAASGSAVTMTTSSIARPRQRAQHVGDHRGRSSSRSPARARRRAAAWRARTTSPAGRRRCARAKRNDAHRQRRAAPRCRGARAGAAGVQRRAAASGSGRAAAVARASPCRLATCSKTNEVVG